MRRREFIRLFGGAAVAWPLAATAQQQPTMLRVGIVTIQPRESSIYFAVDQRLRELGYIEGQNLTVVFLNPGDQIDGVGKAMKELVRRNIDVILAPTEAALKSAMTATDNLPIIMTAIDYDPVVLGYVIASPDPEAMLLACSRNSSTLPRNAFNY